LLVFYDPVSVLPQLCANTRDRTAKHYVPLAAEIQSNAPNDDHTVSATCLVWRERDVVVADNNMSNARHLSSFALPPTFLQTLLRHGFETQQDVLDLSPSDLAKGTIDSLRVVAST